MSLRVVVIVASIALLSGCATSEQGRARPLAPDGIGAIYSDFDLRTRLVLAGEKQCSEDGCETRAAFARRVAERGDVLARLAHASYPDLADRVPQFRFGVPEKAQVGTLSNAGGEVLLLGGLADLAIDDAALDFIIGREMGHVIARHHEENVAWSIVASVAVQLLLPVANVIRGAAAAIQATTTTAASLVGSRAIKAANRADQVDEADAIALNLLRAAGRDFGEAARAVDAVNEQLASIGNDGWAAEFRLSKARLDQLDCGTPWIPAEPDIVLTAAESLADAASANP